MIKCTVFMGKGNVTFVRSVSTRNHCRRINMTHKVQILGVKLKVQVDEVVSSIDMGNNINVYKKSITFDNETKKKITNCIAQKLPSPI